MRYGQCTMNYEAMGRYGEAKLRIERLAAERHNEAINLRCLLARAELGITSYLQRADVARMEISVKRLVEIEAALLCAVSDANAVAEQCQQPLLVMADGNGQ